MSKLSTPFERWLVRAKRGMSFAYYIGLLMVDREYSKAVNATGLAAWRAMEEGRIRLFQRKLKEGCYEYIAVRAKEG
jgi:hypothetical protein